MRRHLAVHGTGARGPTKTILQRHTLRPPETARNPKASVSRVSNTDPFLWLGSVRGEKLHINDNNFFLNYPKILKL